MRGLVVALKYANLHECRLICFFPVLEAVQNTEVTQPLLHVLLLWIRHHTHAWWFCSDVMWLAGKQPFSSKKKKLLTWDDLMLLSRIIESWLSWVFGLVAEQNKTFEVFAVRSCLVIFVSFWCLNGLIKIILSGSPAFLYPFPLFVLSSISRICLCPFLYSLVAILDAHIN